MNALAHVWETDSEIFMTAPEIEEQYGIASGDIAFLMKNVFLPEGVLPFPEPSHRERNRRYWKRESVAQWVEHRKAPVKKEQTVPEVQIFKNRGRLLEICTHNGNGEESLNICVVTTAICPVGVEELLERWREEMPVQDLHDSAMQLAEKMVGMGWGIIVEPEQHRVLIEEFTCGEEDIKRVMRYAPILIDDEVYFVTGITKPAGTLRTGGLGEIVSYINPITGGEYSRLFDNMLDRAKYAPVEMVRGVLEDIRPNTYEVVKLAFADMPSISLVMRKPVVHSLLPMLREQQDVIEKIEVGLSAMDEKLIGRISRKIREGNKLGTIVLASRLIASQGSSAFVRLNQLVAESVAG